MNALFQKRAFTLVELLVVVSIIAVVGSGVAVSYANHRKEARDQVTLHEMFQIKEAFLRFYNDNDSQLHRPLVNHEGAALPDSISFAAAHTDNNLHDGLMEFFETYGLWFLMQGSHPDADMDFPDFGTYNALRGEGWNGPYLDVPVRQTSTNGTVVFPQIEDKYGTAYRMLYYEHDEGAPDPVFRRLLLIGSRGDEDWDELTELVGRAGNLRDAGNDEGRLNLATGAMEIDGAFYIVELLNMDQRR